MKQVSVDLNNHFSQWQPTGKDFWLGSTVFDKKPWIWPNVEEIVQRFRQAHSKPTQAEQLSIKLEVIE